MGRLRWVFLGVLILAGGWKVQAESEPVDYLIIATQATASGFQALADFRSLPEGGAYRTKVLTLEEIHATYSEATPEARIRAAIRDHYQQQGTRFVVLGARAADIPPVRVYTPVYGIANNWTLRHGTPSDWYYACLDGEWSQTETGLYGYSDFDSLDLDPEVIVGRIPVVDAEGARQYVRRLRRALCPASRVALQKDHVLLHGLMMGSLPAALGKVVDLSDGYPWFGESGHAAGGSDSELWLRNIFLSRILSWRPEATLDLYFPQTCSDPTLRDRLTDALSINRPADLNVYLAQRPEFVAISSHGLPSGVGRLTALSSQVPDNLWGVLYSVGCNTAQFDERSLADADNETGMAPPAEGAFDGTWRAYSLAEHVLMGGETGGLVYIASTREGFRLDGVGGCGDYSYAFLAAFAEGWAKGGKTCGEIFSEHKQRFRVAATTAADYRSLFVGTTYFGDPAVIAVRDLPIAAKTAFDMRFRTATGEVTVTALPGQTLQEVAPSAEVAGRVWEGWQIADGTRLPEDEVLTSAFAGAVLTALDRAPTAAEMAPSASADPALARETFDDAGAQPALRGTAFAPTSRTTPRAVQTTLADEGRWATFHLRHAMGFENDEERGVAVALVSATHRLEFRRRLDVGYSLFFDGSFQYALAVPPDVWHHLALHLTPGETHLYLNGIERVALPGLGSGNVTLFLGGASATESYMWATAGTLLLDEVQLFTAHAGISAADLFAAAQRAPGATPQRLVIPEGAPLTLPGDSTRQALFLSGTGRLSVPAGGYLPEILSTDFPTLEIPEGGHLWTSSTNVSAMGWGMLTWDSTGLTPPLTGALAIATPTLHVTGLRGTIEEGFTLTARVTSALPVAFASHARFALHPLGEETSTLLPAPTLAADEATFVVPATSEKSRLFRIQLR